MPSNLCPEIRGRIVGQWQGGRSIPDIAADIRCSTKTVRRWIKRFSEGGDCALRDHRKNNRCPRRTTMQQDKDIIAAVQQKPFITVKEVINFTNLKISDRTARRRLKEAGYRYGKVKLPFIPKHQDQSVDSQQEESQPLDTSTNFLHDGDAANKEQLLSDQLSVAESKCDKHDKSETDKAEIVKEEVEMVKEEAEMVKEEVKMVKEEMEMIKEEMEMIKEEVKMVKEEVEMVKEEVKMIKEEADEERPTMNDDQKQNREIKRFCDKESIFKHPEGPAPSANFINTLDYPKNKKVKCDLDDVSSEDMTERNNTQAAILFMKELRLRRKEDVDECREKMDVKVCESNVRVYTKTRFKSKKRTSSSRITLRKPQTKRTADGTAAVTETDEKPAVRSSKILSEYDRTEAKENT